MENVKGSKADAAVGSALEAAYRPRTVGSDATADGNTSPRLRMLREDVVHRFTYHPPKGDQVKRYEAIREMYRTLAIMLVECTPVSREQATALTKLEESSFWANAGIARNE